MSADSQLAERPASTVKDRPKWNRVVRRPKCTGVAMFGGRYTVYENGTVIRESIAAAARNGAVRILPAIHLRPILFKQHYHISITESPNKYVGLRPIHRLVCEAFHGPSPADRMDVNHKDGNKLNNKAENLEWATRRQNKQHAANAGLSPVGEDSIRAKLRASQVRHIRRMIGTVSQEKIGGLFGVSQTCISKIARGLNWKQLK